MTPRKKRRDETALINQLDQLGIWASKSNLSGDNDEFIKGMIYQRSVVLVYTRHIGDIFQVERMDSQQDR